MFWPTGYKLKDKNNNKEYTLIVMGDINSDGEVNTGDSFLIKQIIMEVKKLPNEFVKKAADVNGDGQINTGDSFILKKQIMEVDNIRL